MEVVFITGGASGLGFACARMMLERGRLVVIADRNQQALEHASAQLNEPAMVRVVLCNVTDSEDVARAVGEASALGELRGVVNSAGIAIDRSVADTTAEDFRRILEVNVIGSFLVIQAALPHLSAKGGSVVNISSVSGTRGNVGRTAYGASKGAIQAMTKMMAIDLAPRHIRVNCIAPGPIESPLAANMAGSVSRDAWIARIPQHRFGQPRDIAAGVAYLLDDQQSGFVTGHILAIDGGFTAGGMIHPTA